MRSLRVAAVAFRSEFGEPETNLRGLLDWMAKAADKGAQLICFPETALQGYCTVPEVIERLAEPVDGPRWKAIAASARALDVTVSLGMMLREGEKAYNSQVFIGPEGLIGAQHKMHLCPADHTYTPGERWQLFELGGWRIGATICFDAYFPESARVLALKGADLVVMSFACGRRTATGLPAQPEDWAIEASRWAPSRAFDNGLFIVATNHSGRVLDPQGRAVANPDGSMGADEWAPAGTLHQWTGYCFVLDPEGRTIAESARHDHEPNLIVADLDPAMLPRSRTPMDVKGPSGMIHGDMLKVRRHDSFTRLLEPKGRDE